MTKGKDPKKGPAAAAQAKRQQEMPIKGGKGGLPKWKA